MSKESDWSAHVQISHRRHIQKYLAYAKKHKEDGLENYTALDREFKNIMEAVSELRNIMTVDDGGKVEDWEAAISLVWAIQNYLDLQGHWSEWITTLETGVTAAQNLEHRYKGLSYSFSYNESAFIGELGIAYRKLGQMEQAIKYHKQALAIAREIGERQGEGVHLGSLGSAYHDLGQVERAIEYIEQALAISREIGDRRSEGNHLSNLGSIYRYLGFANYDWEQIERAKAYHEQALALARKIGDRRGQVARLANLGADHTALVPMGRPTILLEQEEQAIKFYEEALTISREIGEQQGEGALLGNLGNAYGALGLANRNRGQVERAIKFYEDALAISHEIGERQGKGALLEGEGVHVASLGQMERGKEYLEQALAIFEETKSPNADQALHDFRLTLNEDWNRKRPLNR